MFFPSQTHKQNNNNTQNQNKRKYTQPQSLFCIDQLHLIMKPVLGCGWYNQYHTIGDKWFSLFQQGANANTFLVRHFTATPLPQSTLRICLAWFLFNADPPPPATLCKRCWWLLIDKTKDYFAVDVHIVNSIAENVRNSSTLLYRFSRLSSFVKRLIFPGSRRLTWDVLNNNYR